MLRRRMPLLKERAPMIITLDSFVINVFLVKIIFILQSQNLPRDVRTLFLTYGNKLHTCALATSLLYLNLAMCVELMLAPLCSASVTVLSPASLACSASTLMLE